MKQHHQPSRGRPALRGLIGLLLTAGIGTAAFAWQSYGETVRPMISRWAPQLASSLPSETPKLAAQQSRPAVQGLRRMQHFRNYHLRLRPCRRRRQPPRSPEVTQSLETMARDLANAQQEIAQLKASQGELARENAGIAEQLKASQEQMARMISSASEQNLRPRTAVTPLAHA